MVLRLRDVLEILEVVVVVVVEPAVFDPSYLEIKGWCGFQDRATHDLREVQAKELVAKLRKESDVIWTVSHGVAE